MWNNSLRTFFTFKPSVTLKYVQRSSPLNNSIPLIFGLFPALSTSRADVGAHLSRMQHNSPWEVTEGCEDCTHRNILWVTSWEMTNSVWFPDHVPSCSTGTKHTIQPPMYTQCEYNEQKTAVVISIIVLIFHRRFWVICSRSLQTVFAVAWNWKGSKLPNNSAKTCF